MAFVAAPCTGYQHALTVAVNNGGQEGGALLWRAPTSTYHILPARMIPSAPAPTAPPPRQLPIRASM